LLAQIYLLAGQGEPHCLPSSGALAPRGDWELDRRRLLARSGDLLTRLGRAWPDDGTVDFLRADVDRARDDQEAAAEHDFRGRGKCTHTETLDLLRQMRGLGLRPAKIVEPIAPNYPEEAARRRIEGEVTVDLLIDPFGRVAAARQVGPADPTLVRAAIAAAPFGGFQAAQVGYYPVWSWLRVPVRFRLGN
jgi:TonB family protein